MSFIQRGMILQHKDNKICMESTAGGAFTAIAEYVINNNGVVFGVVIDDDFKVKHTAIEIKEELYKFRNSKYVQSDVGDSFKTIKTLLQSGRMVCFSGTPCQVEGLRTFLGKDYDNLILVDVVCRAVPSPGVWKKYIEMEKEYLGNIQTVRFRDKTWGYQFSTMEIKNKSNLIKRGGIDTQPWLRLFFSGMIIRPSCTKCCFRSSKRNSDFTIWDCFNVFKYDRGFDETKGTTRMLIHSEKGSSIFEEIKGVFKYKEINPLELTEGVEEMVCSPTFHKDREAFFVDYKKMALKSVLNRYFPLTIKRKSKTILRRMLNIVGLDVVIKRKLSR